LKNNDKTAADDADAKITAPIWAEKAVQAWGPHPITEVPYCGQGYC
jgi:hypothetical protein